MKQNIHPNWHDDAVVTCACGNKFSTGSTLTELKVDICSQCHPFYTGEMKFVDTQGRVEKFQAKRAAAQKVQATKKAKKKKAQVRPQSLRDMLMDEKKRLQKQASPQKSPN